MGKSAFESFEKDELASAILLARATVETSAALWYLRTKLEAAVQSKSADKIDEDLMRLLMGSLWSETDHRRLARLQKNREKETVKSAERLVEDLKARVTIPQ